MSGKAKVILEMVYISFDYSSDFIDVIPFICIAKSAGICTQVLLRVYVNHGRMRFFL